MTREWYCLWREKIDISEETLEWIKVLKFMVNMITRGLGMEIEPGKGLRMGYRGERTDKS